MKASSLIVYFLAFSVGLIAFFATPRERIIVKRSAIRIINIIKDSAYTFIDKLNGIEPYYLKRDKDNTFDESPVVEVDSLSDAGIFEDSSDLHVDLKWDRK